MAILVNMGKRGFVLKEGFLAPGSQIEVQDETASKLAKMYAKDLKLVVTKAAEKQENEGPVVKNEESKPVEPKEEKPVVKRGRPKKVQPEAQTK